MAFKALNKNVADELFLEPKEVTDAYQSALFVFLIQCFLILLIFLMVLSPDKLIMVPDQFMNLVTRLILVIIMHLVVESDVRQGLIMMKYSTNHPFDFSSPTNAFFIGLMQFTGGLLTETVCILHLGSIEDPIVAF